jgi:hypothetical protein
MTPQSASAPDSAGDSRAVYPCTLHHSGRLGGLYTLYAETQQARAEWKQKLQEAIGLRNVVQESNKVFEIETLSADTFLNPSMTAAGPSPAWNHENSFTGKVTCSVPFSTLCNAISCDYDFKSSISQLQQMDVVSLPSAVLKVSGSDFAMILDVTWLAFNSVTLADNSSFSYASCAAS